LTGKNTSGETVPIYEGDIVNVSNGGDWELSQYEGEIVEWTGFGWWPFTDASRHIDLDYICSKDPELITVTGNIVENPPAPEVVAVSEPTEEEIPISELHRFLPRRGKMIHPFFANSG
jgi:hypothetical protein